MSSELVLPASTRNILEGFGLFERHPGLQLDKLSITGKQDVQKGSLEEVCKVRGEPKLFEALSKKRDDWLNNLSAVTWRCRNTTALTLHLARASALENAGICLHPVYGFAYLPGSGLKGMARSYAETVWFPAQYRAAKDGVNPANEAERDKARAAWEIIEAVFGWAPHSNDRKEAWLPTNLIKREKNSACSGGVVFHDAWPLDWPRLIVDITNNHHHNYYQGNDAPGDWDNPIPVYFLAVPPGTTFSFAVSPRVARAEDAKLLVEKTQEWLLGALCHQGAGAKTNSGYGVFEPSDGKAPALVPTTRKSFEATLELVSPAFLAGAQQTEDDCDLRTATLRGLLRWWWRTMHVGFMDNKTLKELETAIWGDAQTGGAVRTVVLPINSPQPLQYRKDDYRQLKTREGKTRMGLDYFAYGMWAQGPRGRDRFYMPEGAKWSLEIHARKSVWNKREMPSEDVLQQATCALWLLSRFGGIGSRGRKGFGSLADVEVDGISGLDDIRRIAVELRFNLGLRSEFDERLAESPNLYQIIRINDIPAPQIEPFDVLHQLSAIAQGFADDNANKQIKMALGLPRQIYGPRNEPLRLQDPHKHKPPVNLECRKGERFASPVHYHLTRRADGGLAVRMVAFPSKYLPSYEECRKFLEELQRHLETNLPRQLDSPTPSRPSRRPTYKPSPPLSSPAGSPVSLAFGDYVETILLEEKTKRGGWKAKHEPTSMVGPIQNTEDVPADKKPGDIVELRVQIPKPHDFAFRWPTEQDRERDSQAKKKRTGPDRRGGRPGGWKDRS